MSPAGVRYTEPSLIEEAVAELVRRLVERHKQIMDILVRLLDDRHIRSA